MNVEEVSLASLSLVEFKRIVCGIDHAGSRYDFRTTSNSQEK